MVKINPKLLKERFIQRSIFFERTNDLLRKLFFPYKIYRYLNLEKHYNVSFKFPSVLFIESTNACNIKCIFCPRIKSQKKIGFMDYKIFKKIIDECVNYDKLIELYLHKDGEPLLHPQLSKMIKYAKNKEISKKIAIASNGVILDAKKSKEILKSGLDELTISMDAVTKENYEKLKGVPAFDTVEENVMNFIKMRNELGLSEPIVKLKIIYMKETKKEVNDFIKRWKPIADSVPVRTFITWAEGVEDRNVNVVKPPKEPHPCVAPFTNLAINWDGRISVCCVDWNTELIMGDVTKQTIYDIWHGKPLRKLRMKHLNGDLKDLQCSVCDFRFSLPKMNLLLRKRLMKKTLTV